MRYCFHCTRLARPGFRTCVTHAGTRVPGGYGPCGTRLYDVGYGGFDYGDNAGQLGVDAEGDLTIGIGNGLAVDVTDGDLVVDVPGTNFGFDVGGGDDGGEFGGDW
jgi:hypothetical protein